MATRRQGPQKGTTGDPVAFLFTSESVTEGHPDKMCDVVSDAILDACLRQNPRSRVACETGLKHGPVQMLRFTDGTAQSTDTHHGSVLMLLGEVTTRAHVDVVSVALAALRDIGFNGGRSGFDPSNCMVVNAIGTQSPDISQGVTAGAGLHDEQGAGDQGMMFGYADDSSEQFAPGTFMPASHLLAQMLTRQLTQVRRDNLVTGLYPDGKSQVTLEYRDGKPVRVHTVVISCHHGEIWAHPALTRAITEHVIKPVLEPTGLLDDNTIIHVNPTGAFSIGGPEGDAGVTGRKIIVDTYGGWGGHGGGAFSGKDPSKVDRSAAYMTRYIAKNVVAAGLARRCLVQVAYAIGVAKPMNVTVETYGTAKPELCTGTQFTDPNALIAAIITEVFDLRPAAIIRALNLLRPGYAECARSGHFGFAIPAGPYADRHTWEATDRVKSVIRQAARFGVSRLLLNGHRTEAEREADELAEAAPGVAPAAGATTTA